MSGTSNIAQKHDIYPRRYFDHSPTWFAWNKLSAADVYALREERGFEGQHIFFWLNHPIQLVRLVGMVISIDVVAFGKFCLLTLDDSSGANIEVKIECRRPSATDDAVYPSNTEVDSVDVLVSLGHVVVLLDKQPLEVGSVVRAQGNIRRWQDERQLHLRRLFRVENTNEERRRWSQVVQWKKTVLSQPWTLSATQRNAIDHRLKLEEAARQAKSRKRQKYNTKREEEKRLKEAERERRRRELEEEMNKGALPGSEILPKKPWEN